MIEHVISLHDRGKTFQVSLDDKVSIQLAENPTTGYQWQLNEINNPALILQYSDFLTTAESNLGSAGTRVFTFIAQSPGVVKIHLKLMRRWMSPDDVIDNFEVAVCIA